MLEVSESAEHSERLVDAIDRTLAADDLPPLDERLRAAIAGAPRHLFFHRYTIEEGGAVHQLADPPTAEQLELVYSDRGFGHVAPDGSQLPSTNSVPSFMMRLLRELDVRSGHRVLEIGSGSGWLVAVMSGLAGPHGRVVGVEIIGSLAEASQASLARAGIAGVEIHEGDGARGHAALAPFDRMIVTASSYDVPGAWFEQVREGGRLVMPLADPSGLNSEVVLLERTEAGFVKTSGVIGDFVPFTGAGARKNPHVRVLGEVRATAPSARYPLRFGAMSPGGFKSVTNAFRRFLARCDARYVVPRRNRDDPAAPPPSFGLAEPDGSSVALCSYAGLRGWGQPRTMHALLDHYARWCRLGMPGPEVFDLVVRPSGAPSPDDGRDWCADVRGDATLHWALRPDAVELPL
jgi:protein-L-isoaspartate(D-aspartate) O-methyltransferase